MLKKKSQTKVKVEKEKRNPNDINSCCVNLVLTFLMIKHFLLISYMYTGESCKLYIFIRIFLIDKKVHCHLTHVNYLFIYSMLFI